MRLFFSFFFSANFSNYIPHMTVLRLSQRRKYLYQRIANLISSKKYRNWCFSKYHDPIFVEELMLCKIKSTDQATGFYKTLATCPLQLHRQQDFEKYLAGSSHSITGNDQLKLISKIIWFCFSQNLLLLPQIALLLLSAWVGLYSIVDLASIKKNTAYCKKNVCLFEFK